MSSQTEEIKNEIIRFDAESGKQPQNIGMLTIRSANQVLQDAAMRPDPKQLYYSLWYEGEVSCLFADSNVGKSILAVQIAEDIAKRGEIVLYFDFELSDKQFQLRYTDEDKNLYQFSSNLFRCEINPEAMVGNDFESAIMESIEDSIKATGSKVLVIDNLTYLCMNSEKGDCASELMLRLMGLKRTYGLSMLILAHTPKRSLASPITQNDLAGSKKLFNFFDSAFAIGKSIKDEGLRYIKQVKVRYGDFSYNGDNVIVCTIERVGAFTKFVTQGYSAEAEHLKEETEEDRQSIIEEVKRMALEGRSVRNIAEALGLSKSKVGRILKRE